MRRGPSLSVATALQVFQVLRIGSVVLGSILLARSPVGIEAIGRFEAMLFVGTVAAFFWANGLLQGIIPQYNRLAEAERPVFLFQVFALFGLVSAAVCVVFWAARAAVLPVLTGLSFAGGWGWFLLHLWVQLATLPLEHAYALRGRGRALLAWGTLSFGGYVAAIAVPAFAGWGLGGSLQALAALGGVRLLWCVAALWPVVQPAWRPLFWQRYVRFSAPLVLNLMVGQAIVLFDGWLVGWYYGDEATFALYRYGSRELPLALALASGLGTALTARIAADPVAGLAEMRSEGVRLFHRVFPVSIALLFASPWLFRTFFGPAFEPAAALFNIYLLLTLSRVLLPNAIVLAYGHAPTLLKVGLSELLIKIATGVLFIHLWGLPGVAWSAVLSFFWEKMALVWYVQRRLGVSVSEWLDVHWWATYSLALGLAWALVGR
ncbi:MAG: hypothetical protein RMJ33_08185 [Saprospiraceae bacterium]|nr:hypothetical protein [Saprospiraceae bacterium]MDW8229803.1 hypothetical protein [Saprospiraceae bacterium]